MRVLVAVTWLVICLPCVVGAQEPTAPKFPLPMQAPARMDDEGRLVYWAVSPDGEGVAHTTPLEKVRFLTADGRDVTVEDAKKRLATWIPVLIGRVLPLNVAPTADLLGDLDQDVAAWKSEARHLEHFKPETLLAMIAWQATADGKPLGREVPVPPECKQCGPTTDDSSTALELLYSVWKPVWETREKTDPASERVVTYKVCRMVREQRTAQIAAGSFKVFDTKGNSITPDRYPEIFAGRRPVIVSADGEPVHALYLRNLKEDTLVIVTTK